jgi:hypothetical protein
MVNVLAEVFIPDNYLGHESMRRHESMRIRHTGEIEPGTVSKPGEYIRIIAFS